MKMEIDNGKFFILESEGKKIVLDNESEAVAEMKLIVANNDALDAENVILSEIDTGGESWKISQISWARIAMALIRSE